MRGLASGPLANDRGSRPHIIALPSIPRPASSPTRCATSWMRTSLSVFDRWRPCCSRAAATTTFQTNDEQIKSAWAEVLNQYQRRADLIPNLVATVQALPRRRRRCSSASRRRGRKVGSMQATPELVNDPRRSEIPAGAGRALVGAVAAAGGRRELSAAEIRRELPRPAGAARGHGEPHHRGAQPLHQGRAGRTTSWCASSRPT